MSTGITFGGLSSGIDTEGIISKLIALEGAATSRLQSRQKTIDNKAAVFGQLLERISGIAQAAGKLNSSGAFNPVSTLSSDAVVAAIAGTAGAAQGTYSLVVTKLAQAQKIATAAQSSTTDALNKTGTFIVNGKALDVVATDSLQTIAQKINGLGVGATASLIDGGTGAAYLTLSSAKSGVSNTLQLADVSGSILSGLGVLSGTDVSSTGTTSFAYSSSTTALGTLIGSTPAATTFTLNNKSVSFDASTDSLQMLADRINAGTSGVTASVQAVVVDGATKYQLKLAGVTSEGDTNGVLHSLGVLQRGSANGLVTAQDAAYTLDGVALTSAKNEVTGAVPGATITLLKAGTSTLTVSRDAAGVKSGVNTFVQAANTALQYVKDATAFDKDSFQTAPLFGDSATRQFVSTFTDSLFRSTGLPGAKYANLAAIGFSLDKDGLVQVDDAKFDAALADRPEEVRQLFQASGTTAGVGLTYVSSTSKTPASIGGGFAVQITQLATKSNFTASRSQIQASQSLETLTFGGNLFGTTAVTLALPTGSTLATTVAKINADPRLKDLVVASSVNGVLQVDSRKYGSGGRFTLVSDQTAGPKNSGVGTGGQSTMTDGLDIAGTIGGGTATGYGQFLTADAANTSAQGLQILYTGSTTGAVGSLTFSRGLASMLQDSITTFNDSSNGLLIQSQKSLQDQSSDITDQITKNQAALTQREKDLRVKFAAMEAAISRLQAQGQKLSSLTK